MRKPTIGYPCLMRCVFVFLLFTITQNVFAEGTNDINPDSTNNKAVLIMERAGALYRGSVPGCSADQRIHINIQDYLTEDIHIGLSQQCNGNGDLMSTTYYFQVFDPSGTPVYTDTISTTTANLKYWKDAFAGPAPINAGGYTPFTLDLSALGSNVNGDYYIQFSDQYDEVEDTLMTLSVTNQQIKWFDITVENTVTNSAIDGRLWSKAWTFRTPCSAPQCSGGTFDQNFNGELFIYTDCGFVSKMDFLNSGFRGLSFVIAVNDQGPGTSGNVSADRQSVEGANAVNPLYKLFLNEPDIAAYPTGQEYTILRQPRVVYPNVPCVDSETCIEYEVSGGGLVEILIDLSPAGGDGSYTPGTEDLLLIQEVGVGCNPGPYAGCIPWGAVDGLGAPVTNLSGIPMYIKFNQAPMHYMMYDVEHNNPGWSASAIRPIPSGFTPNMYYDDSNIPDTPPTGALDVDVWAGAVSPYHSWDKDLPSTGDDIGNFNTVNTWWFGNTEISIRDYVVECAIFIDDDSDGIPDITEAYNGDHDNDGTPDYEDIDFCMANFDGIGGWSCATDGMPDPSQDLDGDGSPIYADDSYAACGGLVGGVCTNFDADSDGIPDHLDVDSDNDGITDLIEWGGIDTNGDGKVDDLTDFDNDGLADVYDNDPNDGPGGSSPCAGLPGCAQNSSTSSMVDTNANGTGDRIVDRDGDGWPDYLDLDADNDGIPDVVEMGGTDTNGDGRIDNFTDADNDGYADVIDVNCTGGYMQESSSAQNVNTATSITGGGSGAAIGSDNAYALFDTDTDLLILDFGLTIVSGTTIQIETRTSDLGNTLDVSQSTDASTTSNLTNFNFTATGTDETKSYVLSSDARYLHFEITSVSGTVEVDDALFETFSVTLSCSGSTIVVTNPDTNGDGLVDSYPAGDTDLDGILDQHDLDADNDGIPDVVEAGGTDVNGDGRADNYVDADNDGFNDVVDGDPTNALAAGTDTAGANTSDALQITGADTNNDGIPNSYPTDDTDGDGKRDQLDLDADDDGIPDVVEAGGTDVNGDGRADDYTDADNDGFNDVVDGDPTNVLATGTDTAGTNTSDALQLTGADSSGNGAPNSYPNDDTDKDGLRDQIDLDADNDGIPDVVEAGGKDTNGDGRADDYVDADNDGFNDVVDGDPTNALALGTDTAGANTSAALQLTGADSDNDGTPNSYPFDDTDRDGLRDQLDLDADNDGVPDLVESGGLDPEGDGRVDIGMAPWDTDGDGLADLYDENGSDGPGGSGANGTSLIKTDAGSNMVAGGGGSLPINIDGDTRVNHLDLDADNDGILDVVEAGATDADEDGMVDNISSTDTDNDGFIDTYDGDVGNDFSYEGSNPLILAGFDDGDTNSRLEYTGNGTSDSDGDDVPDMFDVDSDNDGIYDNYEAQSTVGYVSPGTTDTDGDGILNAYDADATAAKNGLTPYNHNSGSGDTTPDYLDLDSDGDNIPDQQEAWDLLADGDSKEDNVSSCDNEDADGDGLVDCFDNDDADSSDFTWAGAPADDNASTDPNASSTGTVFGAGSSLDNLLPDNGGLAAAEPDYRDNLNACATSQVYYGISEQGAVTTDYEFNGTLHVDGAGTSVVRATTYCEPDGDGWYYFYNPLEPGNYLFAIKYNTSPAPVTPIWELIDYIELKVEPTPTDRHKIGASEATLVMERDWTVVYKQTPTVGSTFDVKFYFQPGEMDDLDAAADAVEADAMPYGAVSRNFFWFEKAGGLSNSDISTSGISGMNNITGFDPNGIDEDNTGLTDGTGASTGNGKNYVQFENLASFNGGTAGISMSYVQLPVELTSFRGLADGCNVELAWKSASEEDFSHYELEWSGDGHRFQTLETIMGEGGLSIDQSYQYYDRSAANFNYYRLKMVDLDGTIEYSDVVFVETDCDERYEMTVYPNPATIYESTVTLRFYAEREETELVVLDMLGQVVKRLSLSVAKEWNTIRVDMSGLPAATYFIKQSGTRGAISIIVQE